MLTISDDYDIITISNSTDDENKNDIILPAVLWQFNVAYHFYV